MAATDKVPAQKEKAGEVRTPATFSPFESLRAEVDSVFDNFFRGFDPFRQLTTPLSAPRLEMAPQVDIAETDNAYEISADLPGLDDKDVELTFRDGVLTLKGEKKSEREEKQRSYYLSERSYGSFQRSFRVPDDVDVDKIDASFNKGVMKISLPKSPQAKTAQRKIAVKPG